MSWKWAARVKTIIRLCKSTHLHVIDDLLEQTAKTTVGSLFDADIHDDRWAYNDERDFFFFSSRFHFNPLKIIFIFTAIEMVFYVSHTPTHTDNFYWLFFILAVDNASGEDQNIFNTFITLNFTQSNIIHHIDGIDKFTTLLVGGCKSIKY